LDESGKYRRGPCVGGILEKSPHWGNPRVEGIFEESSHWGKIGDYAGGILALQRGVGETSARHGELELEQKNVCASVRVRASFYRNLRSRTRAGILFSSSNPHFVR
jgi:hypothetical protein